MVRDRAAPRSRMSLRPLALAALLPALAACGADGDGAAAGPVVARVGEARLTEGDLDALLPDVTAGVDSTTARAQVIEQWVQRELLVQEARAQGLDEDPAVRRRLADSERATLEAAALESLFAANPGTPDDAEIQAYYDAHREDLALREPYVRLRHLRVAGRQRAEAARRALVRAVASSMPDSLFRLVAREYAVDPDGAVALANEYVPEGRLLALDEPFGSRVAALPAGATVAVVPAGRQFHVVQVVDRAPEGAVPPLSLVRDELAERLAVQKRRDLEAQFLSRLRAQAQARGHLEL